MFPNSAAQISKYCEGPEVACFRFRRYFTITDKSTKWEWVTAGREHRQRTGRRGRRTPCCCWNYVRRWDPDIEAPPWTGERRRYTHSRSQTQPACKSDSFRHPLGPWPELSERLCLTHSPAHRTLEVGALRSLRCYQGGWEPDIPGPEFDGDTQGIQFSILYLPGSAARRGTPGRRCVNSPVFWECVAPGRSSCSIFCTRSPRWGTSPSRPVKQSHLRFWPPPPCPVQFRNSFTLFCTMVIESPQHNNGSNKCRKAMKNNKNISESESVPISCHIRLLCNRPGAGTGCRLRRDHVTRTKLR